MNHKNEICEDNQTLTEDERHRILDRAFNIDEHERETLEATNAHGWHDLRSALLEMGADEAQLDRLYDEICDLRVGPRREDGVMTAMHARGEVAASSVAAATKSRSYLQVAIFCAVLLGAGGLLWTWNHGIEAEKSAKIAAEQARAEIALKEAESREKVEIARIQSQLALEKERMLDKQKQLELQSNERIEEFRAEIARLDADERRLTSAATTLENLYNDVKMLEMKVRRAQLDYKLAYRRAIDHRGGVKGAVSTSISEVWSGGNEYERAAWRRYTSFLSKSKAYKQTAKEYNDAAERLISTGIFGRISLPMTVPETLEDFS